MIRPDMATMLAFVATDARGQTQVLFLDQSALTVGPNSQLVIDEFVYDPARGAAVIAAIARSMVAGARPRSATSCPPPTPPSSPRASS